jgi:hypothetical protein
MAVLIVAYEDSWGIWDCIRMFQIDWDGNDAIAYTVICFLLASASFRGSTWDDVQSDKFAKLEVFLRSV